MRHFRDRNDILEYLETAHDWGSVRIAMQDAANVEFFGFFTWLIEPGEPGWIVAVISGETVHVIVIFYRNGELLINEMSYGRAGIPWKYWAGDYGKCLRGDHPERYEVLRHEAQQR